MTMREERKVVTALFADLVGSTALSERLDPEEARLILGEAVARMVRAVEEYGGTVKDLAGDGVLALFGAPTAHEDDPERAVRAGLRISDEIDAYAEEVARGWGVDLLGVRVGVNTGPVVLGPQGAGSRVEYGATGDAVNTAARLEGAAEPGSVLVAEATRSLVEPVFRWGPPCELALKGKAQPVTAFEAVAPTQAPRRRGLAGLHVDLIGRERELERAGRALEAVLSGSGGIVFISGEPGIGKSRLLAEMRETAARGPSERPALWLEGRCVSYGESTPYWPFRDLVRGFLGLQSDEPDIRIRVALRRRVEELFGSRTSEIYPYLGAMLGLSLEPEVALRLAELSPEALQYRTFEVTGSLLARLAEERPVVVALEDLHWADATSVQLAERLLPLTEDAALLLVLTQRPERDHSSWAIRHEAGTNFPHRTTDIFLEALSGQADRDLLYALVGAGVLPEELEGRLLEAAEGNPFFLEELVRSLVDAGALVRVDNRWRFDHEAEIELPPTVEKVILARIDRLSPECHDVLTAASVLGRQFVLPLLEEVAGENDNVREAIHELQRLDLMREERRWPHPEYRFKHALIQETAYRTLLSETRRTLHHRAARWLEGRQEEGEERGVAILAHHYLAAADEEKAVTYLMRAGDRARQTYALDEAIEHYRALLPLMERRGEQREVAVVLFKLALALHTSLRFPEADGAYRRAFDLWVPPEPWPEPATATLRMATSFLPNDPDPKTAIAWPNIQLCMQLFDRLVEAWPERTIVPSLAERWEISEDGLRYVFHLREGLHWSDGEPLTAHDVEFGIKRVLDPRSPGSSVAIYFVLENGQDYYLERERDPDRVGVRALDDRTVEFRLAAPAPYFMSVMNRPDGGPQPRHAIERDAEAWTEPDRQVVSGPFRQAERGDGRLALIRQAAYAGVRPGNVGRVEFVETKVETAVRPYRHDEIDIVAVRYTPRLADVLESAPQDAKRGWAGWTFYVSFAQHHPATANVEFRRALAYALDREALAGVFPENLMPATGGLVPPALQGHTPDIALGFDPDLAREHLERSGVTEAPKVGAFEEWEPIVRTLVASWEDVLGLSFPFDLWTAYEARGLVRPSDRWPILLSGWLPGYPDPEYYLRLLLHSDSKTNEGGFSHRPFDELMERARQERSDRSRLELYHQADRMAVADQVALIPLAYGRSMAFVKPWVQGWWEFGKTSSSFADLIIDRTSPRYRG